MKRKLKTMPQLERLADMPTRLARLGRPHIRINLDRATEVTFAELKSAADAAPAGFQFMKSSAEPSAGLSAASSKASSGFAPACSPEA